MPLSLPSPHSVHSLACGVFSQAELSWILGAAALVPLSASAWGFGIVQGDVVGQADVGAEGFPEPLAEERCLPCGRRFREQEGAVQGEKSRVKEPHSPCTHHTVPRFSRHSCWKTHGSLFPVISNPSLTSPLRTGAVFCPTLPDLPSVLAAVVSTQAPCPWPLSSLPAPLHTC